MKTALALGLLLAVAGCASTGTQVKQEQAQSFQKGVTTEDQIIKALGAPQGRTVKPDGTDELIYVYIHGHAKAASFIPVVGLLAGGGVGHSNTVLFDFDKDKKLVSYTTNETQSDVRTGLINGAK